MQMEGGREVCASNTFEDQSSARFFVVAWTVAPLLQDFRQLFAEALNKIQQLLFAGCMKNSK